MAMSERAKHMFSDYYKKKETEKNIKFGTGVFSKKFDAPSNPNNNDYFLAEETLVPRLKNSDTQRINMFASHFTQTVHLVNPEKPKVFTNFENQVGEYSIGYRKAKEDFDVIAKIEKNKLNYDLIVKYRKSEIYDVIHYRRAMHITEDYGYANVDCLPEVKEGDIVNAGDYIFHDTSYDDAGNFQYGANLKAAYLCWKGQTYEDAVVISESAAKKMTSYKVEQINVSVNENDVLLNLYGKDMEPYHSFPKVGEKTCGNILTSSRQMSGRSLLYDFKFDNMKNILPTDDITYTEGGIVADLDIYNNTPVEELEKKNDDATKELVAAIKEQDAYYARCKEVLETIIPAATIPELQQVMTPEEKSAFAKEKAEFGFNWIRPQPKKFNKHKYTEDLGYMWKEVHDYLDNRVKWKTKDGPAFHNIRMKFTILKENPLTIGAKVTGRYGNKGVISSIIPDADMPVSNNGVRAEVILNPLGILNRMNPSQLIEQHINFMSDHIIAKMVSMRNSNPDNAVNLYLSYLDYLNPEEAEFMRGRITSMSAQDKSDLVDEIIKNGIYVNQQPFWNLPDEKVFIKMMKEHPDWCTKYKCTFDGGKIIEKPIIIGDIYMIRLKHESSGHFSVISDTSTNIKGQPSKSESRKKHKALFAESPIRLGDMECTNLLITKRGDIVSDMLRSYSSSKQDRETMAMQELTYNNPINIDIKNSSQYSIARGVLNRYLEVAELKLIDSEKK